MAWNRPSVYDEHKDWILEHMHDYYNLTELMNALNTNFGLSCNRNTLKSWFVRRFGMTTIYGTHEFSEEELEIIIKYYPNNGSIKTAEIMNELFHTNRTPGSIRQLANKRGIKVNEETLKAISSNNGKHTKPRKGAGTIRIEQRKDKKGVIYRMKSADGRWRTAGIVIWEEENGPIPEGYKLIYLDGDNSNYQLNNLYLVDLKTQYQVIRNKAYKSGNPEITKSLIKYYELRNALGVDCWEWQKIQKKFERKFNKLAKEE